jgi:hypothetical protein
MRSRVVTSAGETVGLKTTIRSIMALKGKTYSVNTHQRREPMEKETTDGLLLFRQSPWGERNGETLMYSYPWGECMGRLGETSGHVALAEDDLVNLIAGASAMLRNVRRHREQREVDRRVDEGLEGWLEEGTGDEKE